MDLRHTVDRILNLVSAETGQRLGAQAEAALSTLTPARRQELYGRVAAVYEELYAGSREDYLEVLAHYYGRSKNLAKTLEYLERGLEEIIELLMQLSVYSGFPSALNAFAIANDVFADTGARTTALSFTAATSSDRRAKRLERGRATLAKTSGASGDAVVSSFNDIAPDLGRMIVEHSYGEVDALLAAAEKGELEAWRPDSLRSSGAAPSGLTGDEVDA